MTTTFLNLINSLPYSATTAEGLGLLPPFIRAVGHLLYACAAKAETRCEVLTDAELKNEITAAANHLTYINDIALANLSRAASAHVRAFREATGAAESEWDNWTAQQRIDNLQLLAHRASGLAAFLDRELLGLGTGETDPGRSL